MPDRETTTYIPWRLLTGLLLGSLVLGVFSLLRPFSLTFEDHILDTLSALYALFLAGVCFHGSRQLLHMPSPSDASKWAERRFIPALLGTGTLWMALALLVWTYEAFQKQQAPPYPAWYHLLSFGAFPFFIMATLLLLAQNLSRLSRLRILLDSLIIMTTVATLYGYVVLVPMLVTSEGTLLEKTVGSLFTAVDLVLLFCLLFVALQAIRAVIWQVIILLTLATLILFIGHVVFLSMLLSTKASLTLRPSPGVLGSLALLAVAAQTMRRVLSQGAPVGDGPALLLEETEVFARGKTVFSSALLLIFALLLLSLTIQHANVYTPARFQVVEIGGTSILVLLVLRQLFSTRELNRLKRDLQRKNSELCLLNAQLEKLAASDPLTGVSNHRTVIAQLTKVLAQAKVQQMLCSLLFIDLDDFKAINDRYGHTVGDLVLCQFAGLVTSILRPGDCLGRWGGQEFLAILPGQTLAQAFMVAERVRAAVSEQCFAEQADLHVTCSLGVATYPQQATDLDQLLDRADQALYVAKRLGRNHTCLAEPGKETPAEPSTGT